MVSGLDSLKRAKTFLIGALVCYVILVYVWTKVLLPHILEEPEVSKVEQNTPNAMNVSDDPVQKYLEARAKVLQRSDLPWLQVQEHIPHVNIPLFDILRENCKTVSDKKASVYS